MDAYIKQAIFRAIEEINPGLLADPDHIRNIAYATVNQERRERHHLANFNPLDGSHIADVAQYELNDYIEMLVDEYAITGDEL